MTTHKHLHYSDQQLCQCCAYPQLWASHNAACTRSNVPATCVEQPVARVSFCACYVHVALLLTLQLIIGSTQRFNNPLLRLISAEWGGKIRRRSGTIRGEHPTGQRDGQNLGKSPSLLLLLGVLPSQERQSRGGRPFAVLWHRVFARHALSD